jgi:hypothetical protein
VEHPHCGFDAGRAGIRPRPNSALSRVQFYRLFVLPRCAVRSFILVLQASTSWRPARSRSRSVTSCAEFGSCVRDPKVTGSSVRLYLCFFPGSLAQLLILSGCDRKSCQIGLQKCLMYTMNGEGLKLLPSLRLTDVISGASAIPGCALQGSYESVDVLNNELCQAHVPRPRQPA